MPKKKVNCRADIQKLPKEEQWKWEIAEELGLLDRVLESGWKSLSARETGQIGGFLAKKRKDRKKEETNR